MNNIKKTLRKAVTCPPLSVSGVSISENKLQESLRRDVRKNFQVMKRAEHQELRRVPASGSFKWDKHLSGMTGGQFLLPWGREMDLLLC